MSETGLLRHFDLRLRPDPARTVVCPFSPSYPLRFDEVDHPRVLAIVARVRALNDAEAADHLTRVMRAFGTRHRNLDQIVLRRFDEIAAEFATLLSMDIVRRQLIGAYFSSEYSFESAALFNPSIVVHPDQSGVRNGSVRFIMSLRGIGEGHVSSVTFRTGEWTPGGVLVIDQPSPFAVAPRIDRRADDDTVYAALDCGGSRDVSETVLFPILPSQRRGIEDVRLVRFVDDDGAIFYHGTYTAFDGTDAVTELLSGRDFRNLTMHKVGGAAAQAKGMALFPRRVAGRYAMLGRQDSENIWLHFSHDLYHWEGGEKLLVPKMWWEFIQLGNCGSPIEIDEGWLVLTHGVGTLRNYCMGAALLDKRDPSKVLGRTTEPILAPRPGERDGYVPNVVYSCGALVHERMLLLPYGVADSFTAFATACVDDLLAALA